MPLVDGVVYTVKSGDTAQSLAEKYKTSAERIVLYNDIEENTGLNVGTRVVLPGGELPETERPGYVAPRPHNVIKYVPPKNGEVNVIVWVNRKKHVLEFT